LRTYSPQFGSLDKFNRFLAPTAGFYPPKTKYCPITTLLLPYYPTTILLLPYPTTLLLYYPIALLPYYYTALLLYYPTTTTTTTTIYYKDSNTSGYIILVVIASTFCGDNSKSPAISVTFNSTIYSYLWVKTGIRKLTPIKLKDCPYNLFIVIVKHS